MNNYELKSIRLQHFGSFRPMMHMRCLSPKPMLLTRTTPLFTRISVSGEGYTVTCRILSLKSFPCLRMGCCRVESNMVPSHYCSKTLPGWSVHLTHEQASLRTNFLIAAFLFFEQQKAICASCPRPDPAKTF